MILTRRLKLFPSTAVLARAEMSDPQEFARLLNATVPENWPPESLADALPLFLSWLEAAPDQIGWYGWYALATQGDECQFTLIGSGGFMGSPRDGSVQIGYSVLPQFQGHGYATEIANGLVQWAIAQPDVLVITAETEWANPASVRVLEKCGFSEVKQESHSGGSLFEYRP